MFEKTVSRLMPTGKRGASVVGTVIIVIISGAIGFYLVAKLLGGLDTTGFTQSQNDTFDSFISNTNTAFVLIALLSIVVAASAIMNALG